MKCFVLAGGKGDRLWPLSRQHFPKQFIRAAGDHSLFQETIARNVPFCDEFIILTNLEYRFIVEEQIRAFQGITCRCIYEEEGRKTTVSVAVACMMMQKSEPVLLVSSDQSIMGQEYRTAVMRARELAREGFLVAFGMPMDEPKTRFGYIRFDGEDILRFTEKPDEKTLAGYRSEGDYLINSGNFLFTAGDLLWELEKHSPDVYRQCLSVYQGRKKDRGHIILTRELLKGVTPVSIETSVFEKTDKGRVVRGEFEWTDIGELEDVLQLEGSDVGRGPKILNECLNVTVLNDSDRFLVVADHLEDTMVVATQDAVYVGRQNGSDSLKSIIATHPEQNMYFANGRISFRPWGTYELLTDDLHYRVKRLMIRETKTIYAHRHALRSECWTIVDGDARITLDGVTKDYHTGDSINVGRGLSHQITNIGQKPLHIIEVSTGENVTEDDMIQVPSRDLTDKELGIEQEPFVKLSPAFQDYLWGGDRLKKLYNKQTDLEIVAESWELSAHDAGQSVVASGRHRGVSFGMYLDMIGMESCGWKCRNLPRFPVLVKFIDAKEDLSVQVHPGDDYALEHEDEYGKNEMWYVIDCEKGAGIYCGFNRDDITREEVERRVLDNSITEVLNFIPAKKGDVFFIKAGTVHAIGKGMLICEIQQSSNCTYRLYDYDRRDRFGNTRQLHLDKALDVINYEMYDPKEATNIISGQEVLPGHIGADAKMLGRCIYFESFLYDLETGGDIPADENSFVSLVCISGEGRISKDGYELDINAGDSVFVPASKGAVHVEGSVQIIATHI